jgi:NAD(P)-dependent dehydrogenase (short-subunit alcohol dehydrogenase family)
MSMTPENLGPAQHALVVSHGDQEITDAVLRSLEHDGWVVTLTQGDAASIETALPTDMRPLHALVYVSGLLAQPVNDQIDHGNELLTLVESLRPRLAGRDEGGTRVVAVSSRDWLGWPSRPRAAAQAASLIAVVRSLALAYGRIGVTVNAVVGIPTHAAASGDPAPGTHLYEPTTLSGEPVSADDIAASVAFFLDTRSGYITGQILQCCGGAGLLSSMSS